MTPAERQRRHRRKLSKEKRAAETLEARRRSQERYARHDFAADVRKARHEMALRDEFLNMWGTSPEVWEADLADELVRQLTESMVLDGITVDEIRSAIDRRFGAEAKVDIESEVEKALRRELAHILSAHFFR
jgi:hypothetical protein